ncbi:hypothetical protein Cgig2_004858 [Carnegiea gigantea]|uniref:RRM domain-containing protein n=1 Tax=Carnegiea gigantea TaxID=171969 RepID=A0A9Q1KT15_9CARY|nr:hypothetical protein Cgig2_004858 [Carnegiea gigantea]
MRIYSLVDNLPQQLDQYGLKGIFRKAGRVSDVYIPFRKTRRMRKFGFVRFWSQGEATKSILILNNSIVRGCKIHVPMAKYEKRRRQGKHSVEFFRDSKHNMQQTGKVWRKKNKFRDNSVEAKDLRFSQEGQRDSKILHEEVNSEFISWLNRSLVCTSDDPRDLAALASALISGYRQCTKIYSLSSFKFILTFPTVEQMEEALNNHQELDLWFSEVKRWDKYEYCETRMVWLEIIGVPPHGWKWENFKKIADIWGKLICLAKPIIRTESFESMKILIREIGPAIQVIQTVQKSPNSSSMEAMDSNEGVLGFEDIEDDVASANVAQDDSRRLDTVAIEDDDDHEVVKEAEDVSNEDKQANGVLETASIQQLEQEQQILAKMFASPVQLDNTTAETLEKNKKAKTTYKRKSIASRRILTRRRKMLQSSSKSTDNSNKTSEGTRQLARDVLKIGKILGVAVIDKEDATIKRITTSLKKEKKARAQERAEG